MNTLFQDIRYGLRMLLKSPGFTVVAVLTLALGIGANAAIFSVVHTVLLKPLPFAEPERLYMVWEDSTHWGFPKDTPAPANYFDWKEQSRSFESMAAMEDEQVNLTGVDEPEQLGAMHASADLFPVLGVQAKIGRVFTAENDRAGAAPVAVLSHRLWQRRFSGDAGIVGKAITLDGKSVTVVGVLPADFQFLTPQFDLWMPLAWDASRRTERENHFLYVVGRLRKGVSETEARTEIQIIAKRLELAYPKTNTNLGATIEPVRTFFAGDARPALLALMGAVGAVLLIACANLATLVLSRSDARRREMAVRAALGAGRLRMARMLLTESVLLAIVGGTAGLLLAAWGVSALVALLPETISRAGQIQLNPTVLGFTMLLSIGSGILFGLAPAWQANRLNLNGDLKEGARGSTGDRGRIRSTLVVAEIALCMCLLVIAGLVTKSLSQILSMPLGFDPEHALTMRTVLPADRYRQLPARVNFFKQVQDGVQALPGVTATGYSSHLPMTWGGDNNSFVLEGETPPPPGQEHMVSARVVTPGYLRAIGMSLRQGRDFTERDTLESDRVVIINERLAKQYFPNGDALGRRLTRGNGLPGNALWMTIVGITEDVHQTGLDTNVKTELYLPSAQFPGFYFVPRDLVVRTAGDPSSLAGAVRGVIRSVDKDQPISGVMPVKKVVAGTLAQRELQVYLFGGFGGIALLLAAVGTYGVLAQIVAQRTQEFGIRMALGARPQDVLRMVLARGAILAGIGLGIGFAASYGVTRLLGALLFGVSASDAQTFALAGVLLAAVGLLACYVPARRAARVNPLVALRYE
ncbi:MAG: ABC transporter permease [Acidobacteria bacterium]|nr:ABC transporter permease [Acidobacteriota bacterium]